MSGHNGDYVTWGRYDAEHQEILRRLGVVEAVADRMSDDEAATAQQGQRISDLESRMERRTDSDRARRERVWLVAVTVVSGFVLPIVTAALFTYLHLRSIA